MADIDKSKYHRNRYFACLGMFMLEVDRLSENFLVTGKSIRTLLKKYSFDLTADKRRVRVGLDLPADSKSDAYVHEFHKAVLLGVRSYRNNYNAQKAMANDKNRKD